MQAKTRQIKLLKTNIINDFTEKLVNDYADVLHGERGISIRDVKAFAEQYSNSTETYHCEYCNVKMQWEECDDVNGELWSCENCSKIFCTKCFINKLGQTKYINMMQSEEFILCPDCYMEAEKNDTD